LGVDRSQPNYVARLNAGDSITHNSFLLTDWGALCFDLYTGIIPENYASSLKVRIEEVGNSGNYEEKTIKLEKAKGTATVYSDDRWRIWLW
jgi:hypothetical protein